MFINNISASRSDIIDQCLWRYNLKYNLKIPGFGAKNEESLKFGSFIHKVFELGYRDNDLQSLLKIAEEHREKYSIPVGMMDKAKKCIENFILFNAKLGETVSTEATFSTPLNESADIHFIGVIDRVIKGKDGSYLVLDYKTSKREKKVKDLLDDKQMMGYAYAISKKYDVPVEKIVCAHFYPLTGNVVPVKFSKIQIINWKKKEEDKVWRIRKKKKGEFPAQKNIFCDCCEFQPVCERFCAKEIVAQRLEEQIALRDKLREERITDPDTNDEKSKA